MKTECPTQLSTLVQEMNMTGNTPGTEEASAQWYSRWFICKEAWV